VLLRDREKKDHLADVQLPVLQVVVIEDLGDKADQDQDLDMVENDREVLAVVLVDQEAGQEKWEGHEAEKDHQVMIEDLEAMVENLQDQDHQAIAENHKPQEEDHSAMVEDLQAIKENLQDQDLQAMVEDLQAMVEDLQAMAEDLQAMVEDLQAMVEDLQDQKVVVGRQVLKINILVAQGIENLQIV